MSAKPQTIQQAIDAIIRDMTEDDKDALIQTGPEMFHMTAGRAIRNNLGLWDEHHNPIVRDAEATYGVTHADDISGLILLGVYGAVSGEPVDLDQEAASYRQHWAEQDPKPVPAGFKLIPDPLVFPNHPVYPRG